MQVGLFSLLVRRSLRQHALSTAVTVVSVALGCGLVMAVFAVRQQTHDAFAGSSMGFDAVLGARGSPLQLVLNTVFHLETSPGNIPWAQYTQFKRKPLSDAVALAVPYAVGDNYQGFRIVGTTTEIFTSFEYQQGRKFEPEPGGRIFEPDRREAVIGSFVAQKAGLQVGSTFHPTHGVSEAGHQHQETYTVVGVLEPTNSPSDRVIWIPLEGMFRMEGHVLRGAGHDYVAQPHVPIPDENKDLSAVMLKLRNPASGMSLQQKFNVEGGQTTLAWPVEAVMADLFNKIGWVDRILELVAYLVVLVSAGSILASIYNTMNERRREFAILRALGARRATVFTAIVLESATIAALGAALGFAVYFAILSAAAYIIRMKTGVVLDLTQYHPVLATAPLGMIVLGALAGIVPAVKAYGTDVATNLTPNS